MHIYTEEQIKEICRCADDPAYFIQKYCLNISGLQKTHLYFIKYCEVVLVDKKRCTGYTSLMCSYFLWYSMFNRDKLSLLGGFNHSSRSDMINVILKFYKNLPDFLKLKIAEYGKTGISFENGSSIISNSFSSHSHVRGYSLSLIYLDEAGNYPDENIADFWSSYFIAVPPQKFIISSSKGCENIDNIFLDGLRQTFQQYDIDGTEESFMVQKLKGIEPFSHVVEV